MWVTANQRLSANRRFVTCNPETCDLREENGLFEGVSGSMSDRIQELSVFVCVCYYLSTENNMSGPARLIHTKTIYEYLFLHFALPCKPDNNLLVLKLDMIDQV